MGIFTSLEENLEKYIEGFFKSKSGDKLEPVEIARRLFREMRDKKKISISHVYVPNTYIVFLNPADLESISGFSARLAEELENYIKEKSLEKKYILTDRPVVKIERDENLPAGLLRLESEFTAVPPEKAGGEKLERTQPFKFRTAVPAARPGQEGILAVDAGPDRGKIFALRKLPSVIGRSRGCDIVLNDSTVSRRHACLDRKEGLYVITDLVSTNGTKVNGEKITGSAVLKAGDVITVGTTVCAFRVE